MPDPLVVPIPPSANAYWKPRAIRVKGTGKWIGTIYKTTEAKVYQADVYNRALVAGWKPIEKGVPVVLYMAWFRPANRGDLGNREKCLEDALQGAMYVNDSQVHERHAFVEKVGAEDERFEVWVERRSERLPILTSLWPWITELHACTPEVTL